MLVNNSHNWQWHLKVILQNRSSRDKSALWKLEIPPCCLLCQEEPCYLLGQTETRQVLTLNVCSCWSDVSMQVINQSQLAACIQFLYKKNKTAHFYVFIHAIIKVLLCKLWCQMVFAFICMSTHLSDGVDGVPALRQDLWVGVVEKADESWQ